MGTVPQGTLARTDACAGNELTGLDPQAAAQRRALGDEEWLGEDTGEFVDGSPVFGPGVAYCRSGGRIDAVDLAAGAVRWTRRLPAPIVGGPSLAGDTVHLARLSRT